MADGVRRDLHPLCHCTSQIDIYIHTAVTAVKRFGVLKQLIIRDALNCESYIKDFYIVVKKVSSK